MCPSEDACSNQLLQTEYSYEISDSFNKKIHYSIPDLIIVIDGSPYGLLLYNSQEHCSLQQDRDLDRSLRLCGFLPAAGSMSGIYAILLFHKQERLYQICFRKSRKKALLADAFSCDSDLYRSDRAYRLLRNLVHFSAHDTRDAGYGKPVIRLCVWRI